MIEEFRERENMMLAIIDLKLNEYQTISSIVNLNTQLNEGKPSPQAMLEVSELISSITFEHAMSSITLRIWEQELSKNFLMPVICDIVNYFIRQFKVKESVTGVEIMQYAINLMVRNPDMRIKELIMIFRDALAGSYGPTFQRIGIDTLYEWEAKYYERSCAHLETKVSSEKIGGSRGEIAVDPMEARLKNFASEQKRKREISDSIWQRENRRNEIMKGNFENDKTHSNDNDE